MTTYGTRLQSSLNKIRQLYRNLTTEAGRSGIWDSRITTTQYHSYAKFPTVIGIMRTTKAALIIVSLAVMCDERRLVIPKRKVQYECTNNILKILYEIMVTQK